MRHSWARASTPIIDIASTGIGIAILGLALTASHPSTSCSTKSCGKTGSLKSLTREGRNFKITSNTLIQSLILRRTFSSTLPVQVLYLMSSPINGLLHWRMDLRCELGGSSPPLALQPSLTLPVIPGLRISRVQFTIRLYVILTLNFSQSRPNV